jgi:predicted CopG family antitoxin
MPENSNKNRKRAYGLYISEETYYKLKQAYYQKRAENKEIKSFDDFINYLIRKDQVQTY